jgi:type II secretory pathway component PulC
VSRSLPIIILLVVTALAAGSAWGANTLIAHFVAPEGPVPETGEVIASAEPASPGTAPSRTASVRALSVEEYLGGIMRRNLFDIAIIDAWKLREPAGPGASVATSDLKVKLLATMVATPAEFSNALIADESSPDLPSAYSIGDMLHDRKVVSIENDKVGLERQDGTIEYLTMGSGELVRGVASGEPAASGEEGGVSQLSENKFVVSKDLFDKNINDLEGISRMGRALLHRGPDGEFDGYRLSAIRRNTLADQLGIKNGDIIHSVNGQPLNSVQAAMTAYNTMQTQSSFCFEISRRGTPTELCYEVR